MTERPRRAVRAGADALQIGRSSLRWHGGGFDYRIDERGFPLPRRLRGSVRVQPLLLPDVQFPLDVDGHHHWSPLAPCARVQVDLEQPRQRWSGHAYLDSNWGDRPLEQDFRGWQWSRTSTGATTTVFYEPSHRRDQARTLAVRFADGGWSGCAAIPQAVPLPRSGWRIARSVRSEDSGRTAVMRTLLDAPFYARTLLRVAMDDAPALCVHESLSLERFSSHWVRCLLPFRMPRRAAAQRPEEASSEAR